MKIKILEEGTPQPHNQEGLDELIRHILLNEYDEIVYDNSREHEFHWLFEREELKDALTKDGINTKLVIFKNGKTYFNTDFYQGKVKIINSPYHLIRDTIFELKNFGINPKDYKVDNFKTPILYLNGKPHTHRCIMMNEFQKTNLSEITEWSWVFTQMEKFNQQPFKFDSWKEIQKSSDVFGNQDFISNQVGLDIIKKPFFQLVSETTSCSFFLTEKTAKPLLLKQPFLVYSCAGFHKELKDMGFELYDELFDYTFDFIEDDVERAKLILKECEKLYQYDLNKLYNAIEDKLIYNMNRCYELVNDRKNNLELYNYVSERWIHFKPYMDMHHGTIHTRHALNLFDE